MKIELIRRVPTMKTEYFDISGIFLQLFWRVLKMLTDYFEINGIFLRFSILTRRSFPTIFRQLSDELIKINSSTSGIRTYDLLGYNLILYHCATLTCTSVLYTTYFVRQYSVYLRQYCSFLRKHCANRRQYCVTVFLHQHSVHLRQCCIFLR